MMVGQQLWISFLGLFFRCNVVTPASVLPHSDHGTLFYTHGRTPKSGGRPVIVVFIFEPLLQVQCCVSCFRVANFRPWNLVLHTWEDTKKWWSATNSTFHFCPWLAGHGRWLAGHGGWLAGHLQEIHLAGQLSAFEHFTAVQLFFPKYLSIRGIFWEGKLGCIPSPFTPPFLPI